MVAAVAILAILFSFGRAKYAWVPPFVLLAAALGYCVLHSGVHATVAGVAAAFAVPLRRDARGKSMLLRLEHALVPWSAWLIVPLFGFANAGVSFAHVGHGLSSALPVGIGIGLFLGKQFGILGAIFIADRSGFAPRPAGASWPQLWGLAVLCGIGFTMSLFIGQLAFPQDAGLIEDAKIGILGGSLASAVLGYAVLRLVAPKPPPSMQAPTSNAAR